MTKRRWKAVAIALVATILAMIILSTAMETVRRCDAQGSEFLAAEMVGILTWWILDIRAIRADRMERRRRSIVRRNRQRR